MAHVSADDLFRVMQSKFAMDDEMAARIRSMCEAMIEFADEAVSAEREACAKIAEAEAAKCRSFAAAQSVHDVAEAIRNRT